MDNRASVDDKENNPDALKLNDESDSGSESSDDLEWAHDQLLEDQLVIPDYLSKDTLQDESSKTDEQK